jgi:hypothetical protein
MIRRHSLLISCALLISMLFGQPHRTMHARQLPTLLVFDESAPVDDRIFEAMLRAAAQGPRRESQVLVSGLGQICRIDSAGKTSSPFSPYGTQYRGPVTFAVAAFDVDQSQPTAIMTGSGGSDDLPLKVFQFGDPPALVGDVPVPGTGAGLLITTGNLFADRTPEIVLSNAINSGLVHVLNTGNDDVITFQPFGADYGGGVRTTTADFNGDGFAEIVSTQSNGGLLTITEIVGNNAREIARGFPYAQAPDGGIWTDAVDVNNDGIDDLFVAPGSGAPLVLVFDLSSLSTPRVLGKFSAFDRPQPGGVRIAAGFGKDGPFIIAASGAQVGLFTPDAQRRNWELNRAFADLKPFGNAPSQQLFFSIFTAEAPR